VLVAAVTAAAKVVTPTVVPIVVPTVLMHQNTAIAIAATVLASSLPGDKRRFIIRTPSFHLINRLQLA
jgi:fructose-bisphosphate aldolase class 1